MKRVEVEQNESLEELLRRLYVDEGMSIYDIGDKLNVTYKVVLKWLKLAKIYSRNLGLE